MSHGKCVSRNAFENFNLSSVTIRVATGIGYFLQNLGLRRKFYKLCIDTGGNGERADVMDRVSSRRKRLYY